MSGYVSVPEKTLEHWSSQYIISRFSSGAALWWPTSGEDIKFEWLPGRPGKAVQLELKTTTVSTTDPGRHEVLVDLGQLETYRQLPLGRQPFYVFPWPDWLGKLADDAAKCGPPVTELAFQRSGPGWWFADWMVVMTTRQVATVLDGELKRHGSQKRGKTRPLVRFQVKVSGAERESQVTWGSAQDVIDPPEIVGWADFWTELKWCGRAEWPQLIRLPAWMVEAHGSYPHKQVAELLANSTPGSADGRLGQEISFVTLGPDGDGIFRSVGDAVDELQRSVPDRTHDGAEGHRLVAYLDASQIFRLK